MVLPLPSSASQILCLRPLLFLLFVLPSLLHAHPAVSPSLPTVTRSQLKRPSPESADQLSLAIMRDPMSLTTDQALSMLASDELAEWAYITDERTGQPASPSSSAPSSLAAILNRLTLFEETTYINIRLVGFDEGTNYSIPEVIRPQRK